MEDPEPGIGKKILSFFINEDTENQSDSQPKSAKPQTDSSVNLPAKVVNTNPVVTPKPDSKFLDHFAALLNKSNIPGPDYFEYKQVLKNMESLQLSEEKLFLAAWASFMAMGGVKETAILQSSGEQYLKILEGDRDSFLKDVEKAINERVGSLKKEQFNLEENNRRYADEIEKLQQKIEENKNRMGQISSEINEQTTKINQNKDGYETTFSSFTNQIRLDLEKINKYLTKQ